MRSVQPGRGSDKSLLNTSGTLSPTSSPQALSSGLVGPAGSFPGAPLEPVARSDLGQQAIKLSILMPSYNEERTIEQAINEVLSVEYPCDIELIVVDDGSTDRTPRLLEYVNDCRVRTYSHPHNLGKGAAVLSAAALATGTHVLLFDADLEYSPHDIPRMLEPVRTGRCSVVYGARLRGYNTVYPSYLYAAANRLLTRAVNVLFNACVTDLHTCMKLVPLPLLKGLRLTEPRFGLDTELTALMLRLGVRPFEVAVSYRGRSRADGKKIALRDAVACAWVMLRVRLLLRSRLTLRGAYECVEGITGGEVRDLQAQQPEPVTGQQPVRLAEEQIHPPVAEAVP